MRRIVAVVISYNSCQIKITSYLEMLLSDFGPPELLKSFVNMSAFADGCFDGVLLGLTSSKMYKSNENTIMMC